MKRLVIGVAMFLPAFGLNANDGLDFHDDYYLGFSQGAYYGLMLGGVDYDVAWCVKSELAHVGSDMGSGGEFQARMESMLADCRGQYPARAPQ